MSDETSGTREALEQRIREAREKSSAFEAENREREELRELERKAQLEENRVRDLPHIQKAEDEHDEIKVVKTPRGAIVVKRPHHLAFSKFTQKASAEKGIADLDIWRLVRKCIVYPDVAKAEAITEDYPGVTARLGTAVVELGNGDIEEVEGK